MPFFTYLCGTPVNSLHQPYLLSQWHIRWGKIAELDSERNIKNPKKITEAILQETEYFAATLTRTHEQGKLKVCSQS